MRQKMGLIPQLIPFSFFFFYIICICLISVNQYYTSFFTMVSATLAYFCGLVNFTSAKIMIIRLFVNSCNFGSRVFEYYLVPR